jgi:hypothetical protein
MGAVGRKSAIHSHNGSRPFLMDGEEVVASCIARARRALA